MSINFLNLRHLKAFREVAFEKGISAAAARVHLSQPAVTQAMAGLEAHFDTSLFDRRREGMFVTDAGDALLSRVKRLFDLLNEGAELAMRSAMRNGEQPSQNFQNSVTAAQLRALVAIWDTGSFSMAARHIGISQPSLHRAGRDLEQLASMSLFSSTRKGIVLTPPAEIFARSVKLAAAELRQAHEEISRLLAQDSSSITVGSLPLSRTSILPEAIHRLLQDGSAIQVRTIEGPYSELLRGLRHGDLDILVGALRTPAPSEDVIQEPLLDDPLALVVAPTHPLAQRSNLSLEDTLSYPWIAPPKTTPAGTYLFEALNIEQREKTPVRIVSSSLVMLRGLLARGDYVTIISLHQAAIEQAQGLLVPLDIDLPGSARPIGLTYRKDWTPTPTQAHFIAFIRHAARATSHPPYT